MRKLLCMILTVFMLLGMAGCGSTGTTETTVNTTAEATENESFTLTNSIMGEDHEFTYTEVPQRIVSIASPATEMLLALGLEDRIVGYAFQDNEIPQKYADAFNSLTCISDGWNVSQEQILACEPDFMMFWNGDPTGDYEFLSTNGISTYTLLSDQDGATIDAVYQDFRNMGKIFGVEERAEQIIAEMQAKIDPVRESMADVEPVSVVYVDAYSSQEQVFTAGDALVGDIFRTAGGDNIIKDTTDAWLNVSWEAVAAANPQYVVIGVYEGAEDADAWIDFLKTNSATASMDAVINENFLIVGLADLTVGERIADTVGMLADAFHPED